jgi:hypothetical protein
MEATMQTMKQFWVWLGAALTIACTFTAIAVLRGRMKSELLDLPPPERLALYQRTHQTLASTCAQAQGPTLTDYCKGQAELILHFPECDAACQALAQKFGPSPSR